MQKEKLQKIVLVIIVGITLIYAYINYLLLPKWTLIQKQKEQLLNRQVYYGQLLTQQSNQAVLAKTITSLEDEGKDLTAQIPTQLDKPQIMADIYTIAKLHAVDPQTLKFEPLQNKGDHQELAMNLSYSGQTEDILSLIDDLEHTPLHKFALQSINLTVSKPVNGTDKTNITLQDKLNVNKLVYGDISYKTSNNGGGDQSDIIKTDSANGMNTTAEIPGLIYSNLSPELISSTPKLDVELKFVAYSSPIGTEDSTNRKPWFMFFKFGADSITKMFAP